MTENNDANITTFDKYLSGKKIALYLFLIGLAMATSIMVFKYSNELLGYILGIMTVIIAIVGFDMCYTYEVKTYKLKRP